MFDTVRSNDIVIARDAIAVAWQSSSRDLSLREYFNARGNPGIL